MSATRIESPIILYPYSERNIRECLQEVPAYKSIDLCGEVGKNQPDVQPIHWIKRIAAEVDEFSMDNYEVTIDAQVSRFNQLSNWLEGTNMRGDGCLVYNFGAYTDIPALWTESESNCNMPRTINKAVRGIITQLRLLRTYSGDISECRGFAFPVSKNAVVVLVHVQWKSFMIEVELSFLPQGHVRASVVEAIRLIEENRKKLEKSGGTEEMFFIRLSVDEMKRLPTMVDEPIIRQVHSKFSIVVEGERKYYKIAPIDSEYRGLRDLMDVQEGQPTDSELVIFV